ncbi:MAG: hypothetical protein WCX79_02255 [Candidatus Paceibacterota bacterium]|jgi:hypothetical protein
MENKKFKIKYMFQTYPVSTAISLVEPIEEGGLDPKTSGRSIETLVEYPLLEAAKAFTSKGIKTVSSSANKKNIKDGEVYIILDYSSLNETNRNVVEGIAKVYEQQFGKKDKLAKISVPINDKTTVGDIIMKFREITNKFENQS